MIGNTIEFIFFNEYNKSPEYKGDILIGKVVDAYTKVTGHVSGSGDVFLGFGESEVSGSTKSKRMYKVEIVDKWDNERKFIKYKDIEDWQLKRIISFSNSTNQEVNEEKIKMN